MAKPTRWNSSARRTYVERTTARRSAARTAQRMRQRRLVIESLECRQLLSGESVVDSSANVPWDALRDPTVAAVVEHMRPHPHAAGLRHSTSDMVGQQQMLTLADYNPPPLPSFLSGIPWFRDAMLIVQAEIRQDPNARPAVWGQTSTQAGAEYRLNLDDNGVQISSWTIDWGDGSPVQMVHGKPFVVHHYSEGSSQYTITTTAEGGAFSVRPGHGRAKDAYLDTTNLDAPLEATDDVTMDADGTLIVPEAMELEGSQQYATAQFSQGVEGIEVSVLPAAPVLHLAGDQEANQNQEWSLADFASFTHPAGTESFDYSINWGDGSSEDSGSLTASGGDVGMVYGSFGGSHAYSQDGTYYVTVTIADSELSDTQYFKMTVLPADVEITGFSADEGMLKVDYTVTNSSDGRAAPFQVNLYSSTDGSTPDTKLGSLFITEPGLLDEGSYSLSFIPDLTDIPEDYVLLAVADGDAASTNNTLAFAGGVFQAADGVVYAFGGSEDENLTLTSTAITGELNSATLSYPLDSTVTGVHVRMAGDNDEVLGDCGEDVPLWLFGSDGDDSLTSGSGEDRLVGGPGDDQLLAGEQDDVLLGGDGNDFLDGQDGDNSLDGGNGSDMLADGAETNIVHGGGGLDEPEVVDNGETQCNRTGMWTETTVAGAYNGTQHEHAAGTGTDTASWLFDNLDSRAYEVWATWAEVSGATTSAPFTVFDGTSPFSPINVNQAVAPQGEELTGRFWRSLGVFDITNGSVTVKLGQSSGGAVLADAVRLVPRDAVPTTDIAITGFSTLSNGKFQITYNVSTTAVADFDIGLYASSDGTRAETLLMSLEGASGSVGSHTLTDITADFTDFSDDYYLICRLDSQSAVLESNEANNQLPLSSGIFLAADKTVYVMGTDSADTASIALTTTLDVTVGSTSRSFDPSAVDAVHVRLHGVNDTFSAGSGVTVPLWVFGGGGTDQITGGEGDDFLSGGGGADTIHGGLGKDQIDGGDDADTVYGDEDDDMINGGPGANTIYGGDGDDSLTGGDDADTISGDAGNDNINGGNGANTLSGGEGDDQIQGGTGIDTIHGNAGDDEIDSGDGDDQLYGDAGRDIIFGQLGNDLLDGGDDEDVLYGGDGNDAINGQAAADWLYGELGNDTLYAGSGNDFLFGGDGVDGLYGEQGHDRLEGGGGNNTLSGDAGNDELVGGPRDDSLSGGDGDDRLSGGEGSDNLSGDAGDDVLETGGQVGDVADGGTGHDVVDGNPDTDTSAANSTAPVVDGLYAQSDEVLVGAMLALLAGGVADHGGMVQSVTFYWDADSDGVPDAGELVHTDSDGSDGWTYDASTAAMSAGNRTYLAVATDNDSCTSTPASVEIEIVADSLVIDNSDSLHYAESGSMSWTTGAASTGLNQGHREPAAGTGSNTAEWTFGSLAAGGYEVYVAWTGDGGNASAALFTLYDNTALIGDPVVVDQTADPSGAVCGGLSWADLGAFVVNSGTLKVILSDLADGVVVADAVRIVALGEVPTTSGITAVTTDEDTPATVDLWAAFADNDDADDALTYEVTSVALTGTTTEDFFTYTFDADTGVLTLPPLADALGTADVTVQATDTTGLTVQTTFSFSVSAVNDAPILGVIGNITANAGSAVVVHVTAWDVEDVPGATNPDDPYGSLVFSLVSPPTGAQINADTGVITWTPTTGQISGTPYTITARVTDSASATADISFEVTVEDALPPAANLLTNAGFESPTVSGNVGHYSSISGWVLNSGPDFELHRPPANPSAPYITPAEGNQYLAMDAANPSTVSVYQSFDTITGATYHLSLSLAPAPGTDPWVNLRETKVYNGSGVTGTVLVDSGINIASQSGWTSYSYSFTALSAVTTVSVAAWGYYFNAVATYLDAVVLTRGEPIVTSVRFLTRQEAGVEGQAGYGVLERGTNPGGVDSNGNVLPGTSDTPGFGGGDRFFPDANVHNLATGSFMVGIYGNDIVRVRAYLQGATDADVGITKVYFRSLDVDDPSSDEKIDTNDRANCMRGITIPRANDNRGRLVAGGAGWLPDTSQRPDAGGFSGYLRAIKENGNTDSWQSLSGGRMEAWAVVRKVGGVYVADVDLATSYAPGDNFRVAAAIAPADVETLKNGDPNVALPAKPYTRWTSQLSVWREFHVEQDRMAKTESADKRPVAYRVMPKRSADGSIEVAVSVGFDLANQYAGGFFQSDTGKSHRIIRQEMSPAIEGRIDHGHLSSTGDSADVTIELSATTTLRRDMLNGSTLVVSYPVAPSSLGNRVRIEYLILENSEVNNSNVVTLQVTNLLEKEYTPVLTVGAKVTLRRKQGSIIYVEAGNDLKPGEVGPGWIYQDDFAPPPGQPGGTPATRADPSSAGLWGANSAMYTMMARTTSREYNRFADAYLEPRYDLDKFSTHTNDPNTFLDPTPHFVLSGPTVPGKKGTGRKLQEKFAGAARLGSNLFWTIWVCSAYEPEPWYDGDPDTETTAPGLGTSGYREPGGSLGYTFVFVEPVRDAHVENRVAAIAVHEVGHQFGLAVDGDPGDTHHRKGRLNIMQPTVPLANELSSYFFDPLDVHSLRMLMRPGMVCF